MRRARGVAVLVLLLWGCAGMEEGTCLWFAHRDGRWVPLGIAQERPTPTTRSIEDRLGRHITDRRFGGT